MAELDNRKIDNREIDTRELLRQIGEMMDVRFATAKQETAAMMDERFAAQEKHFDEKLDTRFNEQEKRIDTRFNEQEKRFDEKLDTRFTAHTKDIAMLFHENNEMLISEIKEAKNEVKTYTEQTIKSSVGGLFDSYVSIRERYDQLKAQMDEFVERFEKMELVVKVLQSNLGNTKRYGGEL